jgi:hypothetical protein
MPYKVQKDGGKWAVVSETGRTIGRHLKKNDAIQQKIAAELEEGVRPTGSQLS